MGGTAGQSELASERSAAPRLVIFDLDGTLTRHDTLATYVFSLLARRPWQLVRVLGVVPAALAYVLGRIDRGELKGQFLHATLGGRSRGELAQWTEWFVPRLVRHGLRDEARQRLAAHRERGDICVLLSASPDLYVPAIGAALGFGEVVCTGVRWDGDRLDGRLGTPNRQGPEKTRCLEQLRARYPGLLIVAYGNAASDLDHLARTDEPLLVSASSRARREAVRLGIPSARWV